MANDVKASMPDLASDDLNAKGPVADKMEQVYGSPSIRRGVMGPEGLVMDRRILQNVHQATLRMIWTYDASDGVLSPVFSQFTILTGGIGDNVGSDNGVNSTLTLVQTTADSDGFLHPDCPFICKAIGIAPIGTLQVAAEAAGSAASGCSPQQYVAGTSTGTVRQAFSTEYLTECVSSFFNSYSVALQLQGESCTLDLGHSITLPAGGGLNGGSSFVANGNPLAEAYRFLPFYVKFPPGSKRNKPLTVVFTQNEEQAIVVDPNLMGATDLSVYQDFKVLIYGRLCTEEANAQ